MVISATDQYRGVCRITRTDFVTLMKSHASSSVSTERDPGQYWDTIWSKYNVDPLFIAAMFQIESGMGDAGTAVVTHSWGNTRSPYFGTLPLKASDGKYVTTTGRSGIFPVYADWLAGCDSTTARLAATNYYYAGENRNIGEVFNDPWIADRTRKTFAPRVKNADGTYMPAEWAPAGDLNDPAGYLNMVLTFMNTYASKEKANVVIVPQPIIDKSVQSPNRNGYGGRRRVDAIVWHITAGVEPSSRNWLTNPASQVSANYIIERDGHVYELVPPDQDAWANGILNNADTSNSIIAYWLREGANFNQRTVSIEHEGASSNNRGGSLTPQQIEATVNLTAWLVQRYNLLPDRQHIIGHFQIDKINRPYCPGFSATEWTQWVNKVAARLSGGDGKVIVVPTPADRQTTLRNMLLAAADEIPFKYKGNMEFEGWLNLSAPPTGWEVAASDERIMAFDKVVLHTINGRVEALMWEGPSSFSSLEQIHLAGRWT